MVYTIKELTVPLLVVNTDSSSARGGTLLSLACWTFFWLSFHRSVRAVRVAVSICPIVPGEHGFLEVTSYLPLTVFLPLFFIDPEPFGRVVIQSTI